MGPFARYEDLPELDTGAYATRAADLEEADDDAPPLEFELSYRPRNRVLNISFVEPFEAYRSVEVTFSDKIMTRDGATLVPHTLSFSTGGS